MKKALSLILAIFMCLPLITIPAAAYGNEWIQIDKSNYDPDENMVIKVSGITAQMFDDGIELNIREKGAAYDDFLGGIPIDEETAKRVEFNAPPEKGDYELCLWNGTTCKIITYISFTVGKDVEAGDTGDPDDTGNTGNTGNAGNTGNNPISNAWIQLNKSSYDPNEYMQVTFTGVTAKMLDDDAWANIYKKGAAHNNSSGTDTGVLVMPNVGTYKDIWIAPAEPGEYEIRLYSKNEGNYVGSSTYFITSLSFTVGKVANKGTLSLDKTAYKAFDLIIVTFSGITQQMVTSGALIEIYAKGAKHGESSEGLATVTLGGGTIKLTAPNQNGEFEVRLYSVYGVYTADTFVTSASFTVSGASNTSQWTKDQKVAEKAAEYGLIPDSLKGADWTKPITRAEFAGVSVKLYENLTGKKATPVATNPFTDTKDAEILKAFNIGVTNGTSATKFSPKDLLNREQAATMLTRALKTAYIPGWTLATDGNYTLNFTQPAKFADDAKISDWAKPSVYFMVANKIINGMGDNMFGPKNVTDREIALGYANATREQALAIAVRMVENLKDKKIEYKQSGGTAAQPETKPAQPTTPSGNASVVGL